MRMRRAPQPEEATAAPPAARAVRRALPPAGQLRRERRVLLQVRERRLRDLGGLMVEMYRRDQFRQDLLVDRCVELGQIEERLAELDALLAAVVSRGRTRPRDAETLRSVSSSPSRSSIFASSTQRSTRRSCRN